MDERERLDAERWDSAEEGAELLREGMRSEAQEYLERVILEDPQNAYALCYLGMVHFEEKRLEKALKAFVDAVAAAPNYIGAMLQMGHTLRLLGRSREALFVGNEILNRKKADSDAHHLLGMTHYGRGEKTAAREHLELFLDSHPEFEVAEEVRGILSILRGDVQPMADSPGIPAKDN